MRCSLFFALAAAPGGVSGWMTVPPLTVSSSSWKKNANRSTATTTTTISTGTPTSSTTSSTTSTALHASLDKNNHSSNHHHSSNNNNNHFNLEETRAQLEHLFRQSGRSDATTSPVQVEVDPQILTSTRRHRKALELSLLESLADQKDAVNELIHLWMYEHPEGVELEQMSHHVTAGMSHEAHRLEDLCRIYPQWAEPKVRLALLYYFKGEVQWSHELALMALNLKPWHFELYPLLVMICLRQGDKVEAIRWARRALPHKLGRRRTQWVQKAVELAQQEWDEAEEVTQKKVWEEEDSEGFA